jgi:hypothetical protein
MRVEMPFSRLLNELELAEEQTRKPNVPAQTIRKFGPNKFARFSRQHGLCNAGQWNEFWVYVRPDFIWP